MSNIEGLYSIYFYKKIERSDSIILHSSFHEVSYEVSVSKISFP